MATDPRLWQLISPTLPVGAYAYSAGLEYACDAGWIDDAAGAHEWIAGQLERTQAALDIPCFTRLHVAWAANRLAAVDHWNAFLQASRETRELREEDRHLGRALAILLSDLGIERAAPLRERPTSFATAFALAAAEWGIPLEEAAAGYLWAWCENQVAAAVKLVPLGQTQGQRLLLDLGARIPAVLARGLAVEDPDEIGAAAPGVAMASAWHETQYSRLFRS